MDECLFTRSVNVFLRSVRFCVHEILLNRFIKHLRVLFKNPDFFAKSGEALAGSSLDEGVITYEKLLTCVMF